MNAMLSRAALAAAAVIVGAAGLAAAGQAAGGQPQPEVKVTTTKFGNNFYAIDGQGGRAGALVGPDGVFMVDAQFPQVTDKIVAAIRQITDRPIRFLVNTHVHGDHTGGNENFAKMGATILARPMLRQRLMTPPPPAPGGNPVKPAPPMALPVITYDAKTIVHMNGEAIELIPLPLSHTDGDTAVRFPVANVLMTGDVYRSIGYPNIDRNNGGSIKLIDSLTVLADLAGPNTTVVPGHGDITSRAGIVSHRDMAVAVRDRVAKMIAQGMTMEQIVAAKPTKDFDERVGNAAQSADRFVQQLYAELRAAGTR
jgi:glyoxylase-like metal-dependent hydrolase (beta-lactamase superfamily II)